MIAGMEERLEKMQGAVFADFTGCDVHALEELRIAARQNGCEYLVVKKTLFNRAVTARNMPADAMRIDGALSVLFGFSDAVAPAKLAKTFAKAHDAFKVLGGFMREQGAMTAVDVAGVRTLGDLPSRNELIAKAVGSIAAPLRGLVGVLQGNHRNLVGVLAAIQRQRGGV